MTRLVLVLTVAAAMMMAACGDDDAAGTPDAFVPDPVDAGCVPGPDATAIATSTGDVTGTWAVLQLNTAVVTALNSTQIARNVHVYVMTQTGTDVSVTERLCEIKIDDTQDLEHTRMLPKFAPSIPMLTRNGALVDNGGTLEFTTEQAYTSRGITLVNIATDPLPTDPSDPRIGDWDEDGNPGITLLLDGVLRGQAYVIQRDWNAYTGAQTAPDLIEGLAAWESDQIYLGSDPPEIAEINAIATPDPDPTTHTFMLVRIPDGSDCSYVLANQCTLFNGK
jgi:hypothetical protein